MSWKYDSQGDKIIKMSSPSGLTAGMSTGGNTLGAAGLVASQLVFVGLGALSLSQNIVGQSATLSMSAPSLNVFAGTQSLSAGSLSFSNANGVSFGLDNGTITASVAPSGGTLTFFASSNTTGQSSSSSFPTNSIVFRGAGIASVGYSAGEIIVSVPAGGGAGDGGNVLAAGTRTATTLGTVLLSDANGISFGLNAVDGTRITASYTVPGTLSAFAQSNTTQSSSGTIPFNSLQFAGAGIASVGVSNGSIVISVPGGGGGNFSGGLSNLGNTLGDTGVVSQRLVFAGGNNITLSGSTDAGSATITISAPAGATATGNLGGLAAGTQTGTSGTILFGDSNGLTFGMSGSTRITASYTVPTLLSGFAVSNTTQSSSGTLAMGALSFAGAGLVSVGVSNGSVVISGSAAPQTNQTLGIYALGNTTGQSSSSTFDARTISFNGDGIVSVGMSAGSIRISATQSNQAFSAQGGSSAFQTLNFANSNGLTFSNSNGSVVASYTVPVVPAQFSAGLSNLGNTQGDTGVVTGRLVFVGSNNITLSGSTNGGSMTISISGGAGAAGNTGSISAGTTRASLGELVMSNSNNVSFGIDGQTLTASASFLQTVQTQSNVQGIGAGTQTGRTGDIIFANSNGLTFGMSGSSQVTASYTVPVVPAQISVGLSNLGNTAGDTGAVTGRVVFAGGNNITVSGATNAGSATITISGPNTQSWFSQAGVSNLGNTAGDTGMQGSRLVFAGVGAATLSQATAAGGLGTVSINVPAQTNQTLGLFASSQTTGQSSSSTVDARSLTIVGQGNISVGLSGGSLLISGSAAAGAAFSGGLSNLGNTLGDTGVVSQRLVFAGGNNITLSGSTNGGSATITISSPNTQSWFSQAGVSNLGNTAGDTGVQNSRLVFAGVGLVTLSQATAAGGLGTVSISIPAGASATGNVGALAAGTQTATSGTIAFVNSNGLTFGMSGSSQVTASYTVPGTLSVFAQSNTTQSSSGTIPFNSLQFNGAGIASVGVSNGSVIVSATQSGQAFSAQGGSSAFQTLSFGNSNGLSFSNSNGSVVGSYTVPGTLSAFAVSNTTQSSSGTIPFNSLQFAGAGIASVGVSNGSVVISVPAGGGAAFSAGLSNLGNTQGDTGLATNRLVFVGTNNITLSGSTNGGSMTISISGGAGGGGGAFSAGISTQGNTSGTTGFAASQIQFVGSRNITLSQSTGAGGSNTLTILGPNAPIIRNYINVSPDGANTAAAALTNASLSNATLLVFPWAAIKDVFPGQMSVDRLGILMSNSFTATATSQAHSSTFSIAFYTQVNATQLSRLVSGSSSWSLAANANNTASYNGLRWLTMASSDFNAQPQLSNTSIWCAVWWRTSGTAITASQGPLVARVGASAAMSGMMAAGSQSNVSHPTPYPFHGIFSASFTTAMPDSLALSQMNHTGSGWAQMIPFVAVVASDNTGQYGLW